MALGSMRLVVQVAGWLLLATSGIFFNPWNIVVRADELQGTWLCTTRPYLIEFRDQRATFKGLNPFNFGPPYVSQYLEVVLPYSLVPDGQGVVLEFDRDAFDAVRKTPNILPIQVSILQRQPFVVCNIASKIEGLPAEIELDVVPRHAVYSKSKKPPHCSQDKLRRLSNEEIEAFHQLHGAWDVEIACEKQVIRSATIAILPGWIIEKTKLWEPRLPHEERQYPERTISRCEIDPAQQVVKIFEPVSARGGGLFGIGGTVWQSRIREHAVTYAFDGNSIRGRISSKFYEPKLATKLSELSLPLEIRADVAKTPEQVREIAIVQSLAVTKSDVRLIAKRIEGRAGEDPVATLLRSVYPERPYVEQFAGKWQLKSHLQWKPGIHENDGFVEAPLEPLQEWIIGRDEVRVKQKEAESDRTYHFSYNYDNDQGIVLAKSGRDTKMIFVKCRLNGDQLTVESRNTYDWPAAIDPKRPDAPERFILVRSED